MANEYDGGRNLNGHGLLVFWTYIKTLILGWLGTKQDTITGGATTIASDNLDASRALTSNSNGKVSVSETTSTELGYVHGVTSNIQQQLGGKVSTTDFTDFTTWAEPAIAGKQAKIKVGSANSGDVTIIEAGSNINISISGGRATINNSYSYTLPAASDNELGGFKTGFTDADVAGESVIRRAVGLMSQKAYVNIPYASANVKGVASFGNTINVTGGVADVNTNSSALRNGLLQTSTEPGLAYMVASESNASYDNAPYIGYHVSYINGALSAIGTAMDGKAPLASPNFTGTPTISGNAIATQSYVDSAVTGAETFKGTLASENALKAYGNFKGGWYWRVRLPSGTSTAVIAGQTVENGDQIYCSETHSHTAGEDIVSDKFSAVQANVAFLTETEIVNIINAAS